MGKALIYKQIFSTNSLRKYMEISLENLFVDIGAKRVKELCSGMLPVTNTDWLQCTPRKSWLIKKLIDDTAEHIRSILHWSFCTAFHLLSLHTDLSVPTSLRTEVGEINKELAKQRWASVLIVLWTFRPQDGSISAVLCCMLFHLLNSK